MLSIELEDTTYTGPQHLLYNSDMAILDKNTVFRSGIVTGPSNHMRVSDDTPTGTTVIQFVHYVKVTNNHVDEAEIVGDLTISDTDLRNLSDMLVERLKQIDTL